MLRDTLAVEVSRLIRRRLGEEIELGVMRAEASDPRAWSMVLQARHAEDSMWVLLRADSMALAEALYDHRDSLLAEAGRLDPEWPTPFVERAYNAYWPSQWRGTSDRAYTDRWSRLALDYADEALARAPRHATALEKRGTTLYWRWLMGVEVDEDAAAELFAAAEADLRAAVAEDRGRANAWHMLSHLLLNKTGGTMEARLAAQRAYEADAYLASAHRVVERLYYASYDLEDYVEAVHWCGVGAERFPRQPIFRQCQIDIMAMPGGEPAPEDAWRLLDEYVELNPEGYRPYRRLKGRMAVAAVLARAGLADSARAVVQSSLGDPTIDPSRDTQKDGAWVMVLLGDHEEAVRLLNMWAAANPNRAYTLVEEDYWWWRELQGREDFQDLATMAGRSER